MHNAVTRDMGQFITFRRSRLCGLFSSAFAEGVETLTFSVKEPKGLTLPVNCTEWDRMLTTAPLWMGSQGSGSHQEGEISLQT